jgi:hypothetical protein
VFLSLLEALRTFVILQKVQKNSTEASKKLMNSIMLKMKLTLPIRFFPWFSSLYAATPLKMHIATQARIDKPTIMK